MKRLLTLVLFFPLLALGFAQAQILQSPNGGTGAPSILATDVSKFGVKADGKIVSCNTTANSTSVTCGTTFTSADVGKPILLYGVGNNSGQVDVTSMTTAGAALGAASGRQPITFTDRTDGCSYSPSGTTTLVSLIEQGTSVNYTLTISAPFITMPRTFDAIIIDSEAMPVTQITDSTTFTVQRYAPVAHTAGATVLGGTSYDQMPYGWVTVGSNGGLAAGSAVTQNRAFYGDRCVHPPTSGTIPNAAGNGTVALTFTGGSMVAGDWPTAIASANGTGTMTVADAPKVTRGGISDIYGTDDTAAWTTACTPPGNPASFARHLTFAGPTGTGGISLITHGISCPAAGFQLSGVGWGGLGGSGSQILYAGKGGTQTGVAHDWILELAQGGGAKVERMGFRGNSMAQPYALMISFGRPGGPGGNFIGQMNQFDYLWMGWAWGDGAGGAQVASGYQLQSCVFNAAFTGNGDFGTGDHIYCYGSEIGWDGVNDQAVNQHWGKIQSEGNNIGFACSGSHTVDDYYTEINRLDIQIGGSDVNPGTYNGCQALSMTYGGESSAKAIDISSATVNQVGWSWVNINGNAGDGGNLNPEGIWANFSYFGAGGKQTGAIVAGDGAITWNAGALPAGSSINLSDWCGVQGNINLSGINPQQINWNTEHDSDVCNNASSNWLHLTGPGFQQYSNVDVMTGTRTIARTPSPVSNPVVAGNWTKTTMQNDNFFQNTIGSILVTSPVGPAQTSLLPNAAGNYWEVAQKYENGVACGGTGYNPPQPACTGTTPFRYQMTCSDGRGLEGTPAHIPGGNVATYAGSGYTSTLDANQMLIWTVFGGTFPLSATNWISIGSSRHFKGCASYNLYGDEGSGAIGFLTSLPAEKIGRQPAFSDTGQWTKDTNRRPPTTSQSGSIEVENSITIDSLKNTSCIGTDANGKFIAGTCSGGTTTANATYVLAGPTLGANPVPPSIVQSKICTAIVGTSISCAFNNPTAVGHTIIVGPPYHASAVSDNLGQTYTTSPNYPLQSVFYKENSAAGVTTINTTVQGPGGAVILLEVSQLATTNSLDQDIYNVGNLTGANTPITFGKVSTSNPATFILGFWTCPVNSATTPTAASGWTLGGYSAALSNSWSGGFVWQNGTSVASFQPTVATANCQQQQASMTVAFNASLVGSTGPTTFRPLQASDLPLRPWSSVGNPPPDYLLQLNMSTGATIFNWNVAATNSIFDLGFGIQLNDKSTINPSCTVYPLPDTPLCRNTVAIASQQPGIWPLSVTSFGATTGTSTNYSPGFHVSGVNGNIVMQAGSTLQLPNLPNLATLGTDANGNVIAGTGGSSSVTSPFTISNGTNNLVFTVPTTGNPVISSTSGGINVASLFVTNLAGSSIHMLHADALGNVARSTLISEDSAASTVGVLGTGGLVANATVTGDTGMFAPIYNICPTNPCSTPAPAGRVAGAVPLASIHLGDFSPTAAATGQVPVWNATNHRYEPGTVTGGGAPLFPVISSIVNYTVTAADFAAARTFARGTATVTYTLPASTALPSTNGQVVKFINYGTLPTTIAPGAGTTINGSTGSITITGNPSPQSEMVIFDGANYVLERYSQNPVVGPTANELAIFQTGGNITGFTSGTAGQVLISAGPGANPTWQNDTTPWSSLTSPPSATNFVLPMLDSYTTFNWDFSNIATARTGLNLREISATTPGAISTVLQLYSTSSNASPLSVSAGPLPGGFRVTPAGDINMFLGNKLSGGVQLTSPTTNNPIANAASLATDASGNIIASTGVASAPIYPVTIPPATYTATAADFAAARMFARSTGTLTITLPASTAPPSTNGQVIKVLNYGTGLTTITPGAGTTLNGATASISIAGNPAPQSAMVVFDGSNYVMERYSQNPVVSPVANELAIYSTGGLITALSAGTAGQFLTSAGLGNNPVWQNAAAPSTAWSSLTNPTAPLSLTMAGNNTTFNYNFPGAGLQGLSLLGSNSTAGTPSEILTITTNTVSNVIPLAITLNPNKGLIVAQGTGDLQMQGGSRLSGPVQLMVDQTTPVASAASLATDASGNIIAGAPSKGIIVSMGTLGSRTTGTTASTWIPFGTTGSTTTVASEPGFRAVMPLAGTIGVCYAFAESNGAAIPVGASWTWNLLKNGAACGSTVVINTASGTIANGNIACSFVAGDGLSWRVDAAGGPPNSFHSITCARQ